MNSLNLKNSSNNIFLFFALVVLLIVIVQIKDVLLLLFGSYVITCSLLPIINFLNKKMSRNLAIVLVYIFFLIFIIVLLIPLINILIKETNEFFLQFPDYWVSLQTTLQQWNINPKDLLVLPDLEKISDIISKFGETILSQTLHITHNILMAFIMVTTFAILVLFMLLEQNEIKQQFLKFFPQDNREQVSSIVAKISKGVGVYVGSKIILMIVVCMMATGGLTFLNVKFALFLGLIAGILEILPMIGPIIASVPAIIVALTQDPKLALGVIVLYFIIFKVANNVLSPIVLGKFLNISPIVIIAALFIGNILLGPWGIVLSPAIVVVIYVITSELYLKKINPE